MQPLNMYSELCNPSMVYYHPLYLAVWHPILPIVHCIGKRVPFGTIFFFIYGISIIGTTILEPKTPRGPDEEPSPAQGSLFKLGEGAYLRLLLGAREVGALLCERLGVKRCALVCRPHPDSNSPPQVCCVCTLLYYFLLYSYSTLFYSFLLYSYSTLFYADLFYFSPFYFILLFSILLCLI